MHPEPFLYRSDIGLYLSEMHSISWLDVFTHAFDLI
jgi:hypothetical protein